MRYMRQIVICVFMPALLVSSPAQSQGPSASYFFNPATELDWASCYVYMDGGSRQRLQFLPVACVKGAPCGTEKYTRDIAINGSIVFTGSGIAGEGEIDSCGKRDLSGKIALFCYDFPDSVNAAIKRETTLEQRIKRAAVRGALGIVLFSFQDPYPFPVYKDRNPENIPEIPVITIDKGTACRIIESAGRDPVEIFKKWSETGFVKSEELISKLELRIEGRFDRIETDNFTICFRASKIPREKIENLVSVNEQSVVFLLKMFGPEKLKWKKSFTAYFADYDSKLFYVHHWGKGLSFQGGAFMVYDGKSPDFSLVVHENTHTLIEGNWGSSSSFMSEGIARYAEAEATNKEQNDREVIAFLKSGELIPIKDMLPLAIGSSDKTNIAYPASGSFCGFLIEKYSLRRFREAYEMEGRSDEEKQDKNTWLMTYGKSIRDLEKEWLSRLANAYELGERY